MVNKTCKEKVKEAMYLCLHDIKTLSKAPNNYTEELGYLDDYGLCLDYVEPDTFKNQTKGYKRWQISFGGPTQEFRLYDGSHRIEFWYLDWFDGAFSIVPEHDNLLIKELMYIYDRD